MKLRIDLHVHTIKSSDARTRPEELVPNILRTGLDGLAITDHNVLGTSLVESSLIIPGIEVSSRDGHIIALGISRPVPRGLSGDETIRQIRELGGISIIAHPYDFLRSAIDPEKLTVMPDAIETINSNSMLHSITWKRAREFAERNGLPQTGGSDSHIPQTIGKAFTILDCHDKNANSVLDAIRNGSTTATGRPYTIADRLRKLVRQG